MTDLGGCRKVVCSLSVQQTCSTWRPPGGERAQQIGGAHGGIEPSSTDLGREAPNRAAVVGRRVWSQLRRQHRESLAALRRAPPTGRRCIIGMIDFSFCISGLQERQKSAKLKILSFDLGVCMGNTGSRGTETDSARVDSLNFKVDPDFKKAFKGYAVSQGMTMVELLKEGFVLSQQKRSK